MREKKIVFPRSEEDDIYKSYALCERDCFPNLVFGKQSIENKPYFYKSFPLTKNNFPLTFFFFFMLPNTRTCEKLSL